MGRQGKWRIFKEKKSIAPQFGPPMWAVWSPNYDETLFYSYEEAVAYVRWHLTPHPLYDCIMTYFEYGKNYLMRSKYLI